MVFGGDLGADASRTLADLRPAHFRPFSRKLLESDCAFGLPVSKIHCIRQSGRANGIDQRLHALRIFDEDRSGIAGSQVPDLFPHGIRGVERGGDGAIGHDAEIGKIKFGASLGMHRHHIALSDAEVRSPASYLLDRTLYSTQE